MRCLMSLRQENRTQQIMGKITFKENIELVPEKLGLDAYRIKMKYLSKYIINIWMCNNEEHI